MRRTMPVAFSRDPPLRLNAGLLGDFPGGELAGDLRFS